jgi:lipopolysaccharide transport system permease protein
LKSVFLKILQWGNPIKLGENFWQHRYLIGQMIRRDLGQRYKGSYLGILWSIINPILMLLIYTFVFSVVFKSRWRPTDENVPLGDFSITLFAGLIPFNMFSEIINRAPSLVIGNANYVKKVVFPLEILVVVALGTSMITSLISIGILMVASIIFLHSIPATIIFLPLAYIPLILLALGLGWFTSSLGVYIRDVGQIVSLAMQVLFFMSPIFYSSNSVPARLQFVLKINPLASIVESFRDILRWGLLFPLKDWFMWTVIAGILALLGYIWFMATKRGFADVV